MSNVVHVTDDCSHCGASGRDEGEWDGRCIFCSGTGTRHTVEQVCEFCGRLGCQCDEPEDDS